MKAFFIRFKLYFFAAVVIALIVGTWNVRGWYEDGKVKQALLKQKTQYEKQQQVDAELLTAALNKQQVITSRYRSLQYEASKISICSNNGIDFLRLFNRGANSANTKK